MPVGGLLAAHRGQQHFEVLTARAAGAQVRGQPAYRCFAGAPAATRST